MTPNITASASTGVLYEEDEQTFTPPTDPQIQTPEKRPLRLVWRNILLFAYLHLAAIYGLYLAITAAKWRTLVWGK